MSELLSCEALTKCYQKDKTALENVDLHIGFGRIVGLLGPNGSGKTTLIKLANGLLQPSAGSIRIAGMTPGPDTKAIVSYLPDADWLPDWMRVEQLVEMFREFYADFDPAKANEMLARLELEPKARLKTLSKGSKEKVQLKQVANESFIFHGDGQVAAQLCMDACHKAGFEPNIVCRSANPTTDLYMVRGGLGISFLPSEEFHSHLMRNVVEVPLVEQIVKEVGICWRKEDTSPLVKAAIDHSIRWQEENKS